MKKFLQLFIGVIIGLVFTSNIFAQTAASATWQLTSTKTTTVDIVGNVSGNAEAYSNMEFNSYNTPNGPLGVVSQRNRITGGSWPANAAYVSSRYIEFSVSPQAGNNFNITNISVPIGAQGGGNMRAEIFYSTDGFTTSHQLNGSTLVLPSGAYLSPTPTYTIDETILPG